MVDYLKEYAKQHYTEEAFEAGCKNIRTLALSPKNLFSIVKFSKILPGSGRNDLRLLDAKPRLERL